MKTCVKCGQEKDLSCFYRSKSTKDKLTNQCRACGAAYCKKWYRNNKDKRDLSDAAWREKNKDKIANMEKKWRERNPKKQKDRVLKTRYGIDSGQYNEMFRSQDGCCAICKIHQSESPKSLHIDHDHVTGKIRGLLCNRCNLTLGVLKDNPDVLDAAAIYLRRSQMKIVGGK